MEIGEPKMSPALFEAAPEDETFVFVLVDPSTNQQTAFATYGNIYFGK